MEITFSEAMQDLLHHISQGLLIPTMVILALCVAISIVAIASTIAEYFCQRRVYRVNIPDFLAKIERASVDELNDVIEDSGLLYEQRYRLKLLVRYFVLPDEALLSLAKRILGSIEQGYARKVSRTNTLSKITPMLGLMGTLIPLGPGIVALGQGQTEILSSSLMIAFDTTVVGLVSSVVCFTVSRVRKNWYEDYVSSMETALTTLLEKAQSCDCPKVEDMSDEEVAALVPAPMVSWWSKLLGGVSKKKSKSQTDEGGKLGQHSSEKGSKRGNHS